MQEPTSGKPAVNASDSEDDFPLHARKTANAHVNPSNGTPTDQNQTSASTAMGSAANGDGITSKTNEASNGSSNSDQKTTSAPTAVKKEKKDDGDDSDSDVPLSLRRKNAAPAKAASSNGRSGDDDSDDDDESGGASTPAPLVSNKSKEVLSDSDDDDVPLAKRGKAAGTPQSASGASKRKKVAESESSDSDVPLAKKMKNKNGTSKTAAASKSSSSSKRKRAKARNDSDEDSDDSGVSKKKRGASAAKSTAKVKKEVKTEDDKKSKGKAKKKTEEEQEQEDEDTYKWWLDQNKDDSIKWQTLEHNGPLFPPPYEPHGVKMIYDGKTVTLEPEAEEVATFFAALVGTDWAANPTFCKNFFKDFQKVLSKCKKAPPIKEFEKCDFAPMTNYLNELKEKKKNMTKEEKQKIKDEKAKIDDQYGWAVLDGRKEKVGNFRIEPPGLFRGRGEHPKTGSLKLRVMPEQVTINIGKTAKVPEPPPGHKWEKVVNDNTVTWLAMWKENVNDSIKYVFLAANSSLKGQSDFKKFEKARELKKHVDKIRRNYSAELRDKVMATRQRATAMYFIDKLALRAGNEKGEDEADTVGCCSLRFEHVSLEPPNKVIFDFLGKDSIRYYNEVEVDEQVFKNLKLFKKEPKQEGDLLFDRLNTSLLNKHLSTYMKGLTAKVFRTFNASYTFQEELKKTPDDGTVAEKILAYNRANRQVAILCNHQRTVPKAHGNQMSKIQDKILGVKYERKFVKKEMLELDPKLKKKRPELTEPESDLDDEFIERHEKMLAEKEEEKLKAKWEKLKAEAEGDDKDAVKDEDDGKSKKASKSKSAKFPSWEYYKKQNMPESPGKRKPMANPTLEKLEKKFKTLSDRIDALKMQMIDKDENKTTALSTSKINYIDPRISIAWCYKNEVPIEKIFNRSLREKFKWALDIDKDW
ncbi:DNA topoisomerase 1, partial [Quaeritorhiza haematococci]